MCVYVCHVEIDLFLELIKNQSFLQLENTKN
jgi:hypothetical protein